MHPLPNRSGTMPGAAMKKMKPAGVRRRHEEDEACGREKPAGIAEIHFRQSAPPFLSLFGIGNGLVGYCLSLVPLH